MKQLQWDKLPQQQVSKTLWKEEKPDKEEEMLRKLQMDGVWMEMEEDFKAKQLVINLMGTDAVQFVIAFFNCRFPSTTETRGTQKYLRPTNQKTCR